MAEEQQEQQQSQQPAFSREELDAMVRQGVRESMLSAAQEATQQAAQRQQVQQTQQQDDNPFRQWVDPIVQPGLERTNLRMLVAEDKLDFYSSEQWLKDIRQHLVGETEEEQTKELQAIRQQIEQTADAFAQQGRPIVRRDLADYVVGRHVREQAEKYQQMVNKRMTARQNAEIAKAKRSVDMGGASMDFDPRSVHGMPMEKVVEQYGDFTF